MEKFEITYQDGSETFLIIREAEDMQGAIAVACDRNNWPLHLKWASIRATIRGKNGRVDLSNNDLKY